MRSAPRRPSSLIARLLGTAALAVTALASVPVASQAAEACSNAAVREQQASQYLPECRGFELVSPVLKNGEEVEVPEQYTSESPGFAASQDRAVSYTLTGGIPGSESAGLYVPALSVSPLPASPWPTTSLAPESRFAVLPGSGPRSAGEYVYFDPQLRCAVLRTRLAQAESSVAPEPLLAEGETREEVAEDPAEIYMWDAATDTKALVTSVKTDDPQETVGVNGYFVNGASAGCQKIVYENQSPGYALHGAPRSSLYEWTKESGPKVASVLPDGELAKSVEVDEQAKQHTSSLGIVSEDGSKVFFTAISDGKGTGESLDTGAWQIYVRENGTTTRDLSRSLAGTPVRDGGAVYEGATADGSRVFFVAGYGLAETSSKGAAAPTTCTRNSAGSLASGTGCDLYEYNLTSSTLTDLSADVETEAHKDTKGANVQGVLGFSADGSYIYFSAAGQLVEGQGKTEAQNEEAKEASVYAEHEGHITYVTNIDEVEAGGGSAGPPATGEVDALLNSSGFGMHYDQARVSPNGQFLLLNTRKEITGYDNVDAKLTPEQHDPEFFEYRYSEEPTKPGVNLTCVSCKPSGERPEMVETGFNPQGPFVYVYNGVLTRTLMDDGRVFFQTSDPLVAQAVRPEGVKQTDDVYEYRPLGDGGCEAPTEKSAGCVDILDSGQDTFPTYLTGASANGADVYLTTHTRLAAQDQDGNRDMYDARVLGGALAPPEETDCEAAAPGCEGEYTGARSGSPHTSEAAIGNGNVSSATIEVESLREVHLKLSRHSTRGSTLSVTLVAPAAGSLTVSGKGLVSGKRQAGAAGSYTLKLKLAAKGRAAVAHHKRVKVKVTARFAPHSGKATTVSFTVTFR